jgi:hypothetical protein
LGDPKCDGFIDEVFPANWKDVTKWYISETEKMMKDSKYVRRHKFEDGATFPNRTPVIVNIYSGFVDFRADLRDKQKELLGIEPFEPVRPGDEAVAMRLYRMEMRAGNRTRAEAALLVHELTHALDRYDTGPVDKASKDYELNSYANQREFLLGN